MIGNKLEQSIIEVFQNNLSTTFSINQISKILKKPYPLINKKSNIFLKEEILRKINVGRSYQCFLNMQNDKTKILMVLNEVKKKELLFSYSSDKELSQEPFELASKYPIESIILYKKTLIFLCDSNLNQEALKQHSILTERYTFIFMDKDNLKRLFMENKDFREYYTILYNPYRFIELLSELKDALILTAYHSAEKSVESASKITKI
jgi:hypothetical protein